MADTDKGTALICGGGPSGLVAALTLHKLGWQNIIVVERRKTHDTFERGKAFNYQIDGRGQRALASVGLNESAIQEYGVANEVFVLNNVGPDGIEKSFTIPFVLKDKQTAYWTTRTALLDMLYNRVQAVNSDGRIKLLYGHTIENMRLDGGRLAARVQDASGADVFILPRLVLGCDGLNSQVRESLVNLPNTNGGTFDMVVTPSDSSDLLYKVIRLPRNMDVAGRTDVINDPLKSYVFTSGYTALDERISLFSLPIARETEPRTANIILASDHKFWKIDTAEALTAYLEKGFPQLDIGQVFPPAEVDEFLELKAGKFPAPQYCMGIHAEFGEDEPTTCVLLGDAIHAFPPDLGLGVNSAMEDVHLLGLELARENGSIGEAAARFETARMPESKALVRLVRKTFPHQYNHVPWRFKVTMAKIFAQMAISKATFGLVSEHGFRLTQNDKLTYTQCENRIRVADTVLYSLLGLIIALPVIAFAL